MKNSTAERLAARYAKQYPLVLYSEIADVLGLKMRRVKEIAESDPATMRVREAAYQQLCRECDVTAK